MRRQPPKNQKYLIDFDKRVRQCGKCRTVKPFDDFRKTSSGIPVTWCRECDRKYKQMKYEKLRRERAE